MTVEADERKGTAPRAQSREGEERKIMERQSLSRQKANPSLYGSKSYCSLFEEPQSYDPGPGQYDLPPGFGLQNESHKESMVHQSITARHQDGWQKVLISKEHLCELLARGTPGPGTYTPAHINSQASVRFGTSLRPEPSYPDDSPGPVYDCRGGPEAAPHLIRFGREHRFAEVFKENQVGPGQYPTGTQFDGTRLAKSFGISHRSYDKVKMPGSERMYRGRTSPGPGNFKPFVSGGSNFTFPKSNRPPINGSVDNPVGPGAYSSQSEADKKSSSCYSFGKPSSVGRFSWKKMPIEHERWCKLGMQACRPPRALSCPRFRR